MILSIEQGKGYVGFRTLWNGEVWLTFSRDETVSDYVNVGSVTKFKNSFAHQQMLACRYVDIKHQKFEEF